MKENLLAEDKDIIELKFRAIQGKLKMQFGKVPDLNAVLYLIGIQEFGFLKKKFTKEQKQDLMHIATCKLLSQQGFYRLTAYDNEGWPHFEAVKKMPALDLEEQELLLKRNIIDYFENIDL